MFNWLFGQSKQIATLAKPMDIVHLRKRAKIVVIDDDKNAFPTKALQAEGFTIEYWSKVVSLQRLEAGDFDIIVLDIKGVATNYSDLDGIGILQQVKKANPDQIVFAFSGETFDIGKTEFFRLADDVLAKPVDMLKCKQVLDHLITTKFTVQHLWESVASVMRHERIPDKIISAFEAQLYKIIKNGGSSDYSQLAKSAIDKADVAVRVAGLIAKIATLCGL